MSRPYHSPSSVELGRRCPRAWAYRYIAGIKTPEPVWSDELKGRARSLALGKALHATLEKHYDRERGEPDWLWFPGQVAASGLHLLPDLETPAVVETSIGSGVTSAEGSVEVFSSDGKESRGRGLKIHGITWLGFRDLVAPKFRTVIDYKTTRSIAQYAKGPAELLQDLQANLYAYSAALEFDSDEIDCRWVYFETGKTRRAAATDFVIHKAEALAVIEPAAEIARELDKYDTVEQAPMNPHACGDYGGCEFHEKAGGPCSARVAYGALIQARVKKDTTMPLSEETKARLKARTEGTTPATPKAEAPAAPPPPPADEPTREAVAGPQETPGAPPPPPVAKATAPKRAKSAVGGSGSLAELAAALTASEAEHAEASAKLEAAKDAMRKALA